MKIFKFRKIYKFFIVFFLFIIVIIVGHHLQNKKFNKNIRNDIIVDYVFDINNLEEMVAMHRYIFVAKVIDGGEIVNFKNSNDDNFIKTKFKIRNLKNIKGKLILNDDIFITQYGGIVGGEEILFDRNSKLLKKDKTYIIFASADENGEFVISIPTANIEIKDVNKLEKNTKYKEILNSMKNKNYSEEFKEILKKFKINNKSKYEKVED